MSKRSIDKETYEAWLNAPLTKAFIESLGADYLGLLTAWGNGDFSESFDKTEFARGQSIMLNQVASALHQGSFVTIVDEHGEEVESSDE